MTQDKNIESDSAESVNKSIVDGVSLIQKLQAIKMNENPISITIDKYIHALRDIEYCAKSFIPLAIQFHKKQLIEAKDEIDELTDLLTKNGTDKILAIKKTLNLTDKVDRLQKSKPFAVIEKSLFMYIFSSYDCFIGELLADIYRKKPELFNSINASVPVNEILKYNSFDEFKETVLMNDIEAFRRNSYIEQFKDLENRFNIELRKFDRWPYFIEAGQRRNIMTHCGGLVSEQYIKVCTKEGYVFNPPLKVGDMLGGGTKYFGNSCDLMMEVGLKLGQTLWRKIFPEEIEEADKHMTSVIYENLCMGKWKRAEIYGEYACSQKKVSSDLRRRMDVINYAIALKYGGKFDEAKKKLKEMDWTGCLSEFMLAEAVLMERYEDAGNIMKLIGEKGVLISEPSYHMWPLFREFRGTEIFLQTYENIYGRPFIQTLKSVTDDKSQTVKKETDELSELE